MAHIKSRDIRIAIKREDGVEYLMKRFDFSTKEELFDCIRKAIPSEAETLIKRFEKKHRQYISRHDSIQNSQKVSENLSAESDENITIVIHTAQELDAMENGNPDKEYPSMSVTELKAQEAELSDILCELEVKHKSLVTERRGLCEGIAEAKREIEELMRLACVQSERVKTLLQRYYECDEEMTDNSASQRVYRELLDDTRAQIIASEKITIFVYQNGIIDVENAEMLQISDEEVFEGLGKLLANQHAGDITINELKGVVKLQKMVSAYAEMGRNYDLVFDNEKVQKVWETIAA